ncbi:hypothetical protein M011DRAFT_479216 [Sporormia fimetaria CBS 119925]|uniref:Uncharacterized protein n=1 Tax=Sporormia fimetaria CBS 119925 TaxID=1340428 RepID=A0A6A6V6C3_9PLEO|nr:hypothetical protein M011DRAFT_479216 [Sporormia fimetaria CBS 119925]
MPPRVDPNRPYRAALLDRISGLEAELQASRRENQLILDAFEMDRIERLERNPVQYRPSYAESDDEVIDNPTNPSSSVTGGHDPVPGPLRMMAAELRQSPVLCLLSVFQITSLIMACGIRIPFMAERWQYFLLWLNLALIFRVVFEILCTDFHSPHCQAPQNLHACNPSDLAAVLSTIGITGSISDAELDEIVSSILDIPSSSGSDIEPLQTLLSSLANSNPPSDTEPNAEPPIPQEPLPTRRRMPRFHRGYYPDTPGLRQARLRFLADRAVRATDASLGLAQRRGALQGHALNLRLPRNNPLPVTPPVPSSPIREIELPRQHDLPPWAETLVGGLSALAVGYAIYVYLSLSPGHAEQRANNGGMGFGNLSGWLERAGRVGVPGVAGQLSQGGWSMFGWFLVLWVLPALLMRLIEIRWGQE